MNKTTELSKSMLASKMLQKMKEHEYNRLVYIASSKNISLIDAAILVLNEAMGSELSANLYAAKIPMRLRANKTGDAQLMRKDRKANIQLPSNVRIASGVTVSVLNTEMLNAQGKLYPHISFKVLHSNEVLISVGKMEKIVEMKNVPTQANAFSQ